MLTQTKTNTLNLKKINDGFNEVQYYSAHVNNTKYQLTGVGKLKSPDTGKWYMCILKKL